MLMISFLILPLASAQLYDGGIHRGVHYALTVWACYTGTLMVRALHSTGGGGNAPAA